jgi:GDP-mannose 6-dehydrogenase
VFDRNVSIAKLVGANREYIVEEIPHISNLMLEDLDALVAHSEVLVIGSDDREAAHIHKMARPDQVIVDLTRGMLNLRSDPRQSARVA